MGATSISDLAFAFMLLQSLTLTVNGPIHLHYDQHRSLMHAQTQTQSLTVNGPLAFAFVIL